MKNFEGGRPPGEVLSDQVPQQELDGKNSSTLYAFIEKENPQEPVVNKEAIAFTKELRQRLDRATAKETGLFGRKLGSLGLDDALLREGNREGRKLGVGHTERLSTLDKIMKLSNDLTQRGTEVQKATLEQMLQGQTVERMFEAALEQARQEAIQKRENPDQLNMQAVRAQVLEDLNTVIRGVESQTDEVLRANVTNVKDQYQAEQKKGLSGMWSAIRRGRLGPSTLISAAKGEFYEAQDQDGKKFLVTESDFKQMALAEELGATVKIEQRGVRAIGGAFKEMWPPNVGKMVKLTEAVTSSFSRGVRIERDGKPAELASKQMGDELKLQFFRQETLKSGKFGEKSATEEGKSATEALVERIQTETTMMQQARGKVAEMLLQNESAELTISQMMELQQTLAAQNGADAGMIERVLEASLNQKNLQKIHEQSTGNRVWSRVMKDVGGRAFKEYVKQSQEGVWGTATSWALGASFAVDMASEVGMAAGYDLFGPEVSSMLAANGIGVQASVFAQRAGQNLAKLEGVVREQEMRKVEGMLEQLGKTGEAIVVGKELLQLLDLKQGEQEALQAKLEQGNRDALRQVLRASVKVKNVSEALSSADKFWAITAAAAESAVVIAAMRGVSDGFGEAVGAAAEEGGWWGSEASLHETPQEGDNKGVHDYAFVDDEGKVNFRLDLAGIDIDGDGDIDEGDNEAKETPRSKVERLFDEKGDTEERSWSELTDGTTNIEDGVTYNAEFDDVNDDGKKDAKDIQALVDNDSRLDALAGADDVFEAQMYYFIHNTLLPDIAKDLGQQHELTPAQIEIVKGNMVSLLEGQFDENGKFEVSEDYEQVRSLLSQGLSSGDVYDDSKNLFFRGNASGTDGDDHFKGSWWGDEYNGGAGNDTLEGNGSDDILRGGQGDDLLEGGEDNDDLFGGRGNDELSGGQGNDFINGGRGEDTARYEGSEERYEVSVAEESENGDFKILDTRTGETDSLINVENVQFGDGEVQAIEDLVQGDEAQDATETTEEESSEEEATVDETTEESATEEEAAAGEEATTEVPEDPFQSGDAQEYIVQRGDTLSEIGNDLGRQIGVNNLSEALQVAFISQGRDVDLINVGEEINVAVEGNTLHIQFEPGGLGSELVHVELGMTVNNAEVGNYNYDERTDFDAEGLVTEIQTGGYEIGNDFKNANLPANQSPDIDDLNDDVQLQEEEAIVQPPEQEIEPTEVSEESERSSYHSDQVQVFDKPEAAAEANPPTTLYHGPKRDDLSSVVSDEAVAEEYRGHLDRSQEGVQWSIRIPAELSERMSITYHVSEGDGVRAVTMSQDIDILGTTDAYGQGVPLDGVERMILTIDGVDYDLTDTRLAPTVFDAYYQAVAQSDIAADVLAGQSDPDNPVDAYVGQFGFLAEGASGQSDYWNNGLGLPVGDASHPEQLAPEGATDVWGPSGLHLTGGTPEEPRFANWHLTGPTWSINLSDVGFDPKGNGNGELITLPDGTQVWRLDDAYQGAGRSENTTKPYDLGIASTEGRTTHPGPGDTPEPDPEDPPGGEDGQPDPIPDGEDGQPIDV